ncbi:hypothetical protein DL769_001196 [Monosporascus sp. CRB-8-3]|nr:hypothetical protein DL769_001196 [Monosporascus sp. CRB-8-3]
MPLQTTRAAQACSLPELHLRRRELLANLAVLQHSAATGFSTGAAWATLLDPIFASPIIAYAVNSGFALRSADRLETAEAELEVLRAEVLRRGLVPYEPKTSEGLKALLYSVFGGLVGEVFEGLGEDGGGEGGGDGNENAEQSGISAFEDRVMEAGQEFSKNLVGNVAANTLAQTMHQRTAEKLSDQGTDSDTEASRKADDSGEVANNASSNDSPGGITGAKEAPVACRRRGDSARLSCDICLKYFDTAFETYYPLALLKLILTPDCCLCGPGGENYNICTACRDASGRWVCDLQHPLYQIAPAAQPAVKQSIRTSVIDYIFCDICEESIRDAHFYDVRDLFNLCLVSRSLCIHGLPIYSRRAVTILAQVGDNTRLQIEPLEHLTKQPCNPLEEIQFLRIASQNFESGQARCYHAKKLDDELLDRLRNDRVSKIYYREYWGRRMAKDLRPVLYKIKDGGLRSFSWEMGSCMPWDIMGRSGWLTRHQKDIESLTIMNGSQCPHRGSSNKKPDFTLDPFSRLESFTWIGIMAGKEWSEVAAALKRNAPHLRRVKLDLVWPGGWERPKVPASYVYLGITMGFGRWFCIPYPAVRELAFSNGFFEDTSHLVPAFAWDNITSLSLVRCTGRRAVMEALTNTSSVRLRLKMLELSSEAQDADPSEERVITSFLTSFRGLENLYLHVEAMLHDRSDSILRAASHHRDTLRRFSYQIRRWRRFLPGPYTEPLESLGLDARDLRKMAVDNILTSLRRVGALGLGGCPRILKYILRPFKRTDTIKILHLRWPGPDTASHKVYRFKDLHRAEFNNSVTVETREGDSDDSNLSNEWTREMTDLLDWIFGDEGIKSVELLAFGDFSCRGRYLDKSFIVRRRPTVANDDKEGNYSPWVLYDQARHSGQKILRLEALLDRSYAFLRSAPTESLPLSY